MKSAAPPADREARRIHSARAIVAKLMLVYVAVMAAIFVVVTGWLWIEGQERIQTRSERLLAQSERQLVTASQLVFNTVQTIYEQNAEQGRQHALRSRVDDTVAVLQQRYDALRSEGAEPARIAGELKQIVRYTRFNGGRGYLWINDLQARMVMHPIQPQLDGQDLSGFQDQQGKHIFTEFAAVAKRSGIGFVQYYWPKPGSEQPVPKLSYVRLFEPLGWVIGSGEYLDEIERQTREAIKAAVAGIRYTVGSVQDNYFWINDLGPRMVMHPIQPKLDGQNLADYADPSGKRLFVEFAQVAREQGEGFVEYLWPKPGFDQPVPKVSYVRLFEPLGWVIGTGAYLDSIGVNELVAREEAEIHEQILITGGLMLAVLLAGMLAFFVALRGVTRPLRQMVAALGDIRDNGDQMAVVAGQLTEVSASLAEGSSEQASSLEETGSTLVELSSQVRTNADNATRAAELAREAHRQAGEGGELMRTLVNDLDELNRSSSDVSRIVGTIDEIAFQTNLLALNAAVEAARAGDAGRGFAVVAEEVRNLASRSSTASQETARLIQASVDRMRNGSAMAARTAEAFETITASVADASALITQIDEASAEQARGMEQVTGGVQQIDAVIQRNAASAEETDAMAHQLSSLADATWHLLARFQVDGRNGNGHPNGNGGGNGRHTAGLVTAEKDEGTAFRPRLTD